MRSRLLLSLLLATATAAGAQEQPAPPPPDVRGPAVPLAKAPTAVAPQVATPRADAPSAAAPTPPLAPAQAGAAAGGHADAPAPAHADDAAGAAGSDAAAAAAAIRGLGRKGEGSGASREPPVPPSLTGRALAEELRRSAGGRANEKEALAAERARLEKLAKEIGEARAALKVETDRLGALVNTSAAKGRKPGAKGGVPPLDTLAKTVKNMKSDQAAALLGRVDRSLAAALLERMKPGEAAAVLDRMDGATSAALVALIARKESP
jgi:flagellar motility protein MotE (MotC chaperone)